MRETRSPSPDGAPWRCEHCGRGGAAYIGQSAGRSWEHSRFQGPYLRDTLMDMGALVETLETSHTWTRLGELHAKVGAAIRDSLAEQATPGLVFCHLSHAYPDGASLYFTFISRARLGEEIEQWRAVKRAASEAIVATGGTITHHHAVGRDHAPYMEAEVGRARDRGTAQGQGTARPGGHHEPREAAALASWRLAPASTSRTDDLAAEDVGAGVGGEALLLSCLRDLGSVGGVGGERDVDLVEAAAGDVGEKFGRDRELGADAGRSR